MRKPILEIPELTPFTSEVEAVRIFKAHNIKVHKSWDERPDGLDQWHFTLFLLRSINTLKDAHVMLDQLQAECHDGHSCQKARIARTWLDQAFWQESPERIRVAIAANRLVYCWGHESRSFALRPDPFRRK